MRITTTAAATFTCLLLAACGGASSADSAQQASGSGAAGPAESSPAQTSADGGSQTYGKPVAVEGGQYREIVVPELQAMLENGDVDLINVHIPFAGNIPGTDESIPFNQIDQHVAELPKDKNTRIVVYCRDGPMSTRAATTLVAMGYANVSSLDGGMTAWSSAGLPLEGR